MSEKTGWIGVDLDATLAEYHGFVSVDHIGEPIVPMLNRVKHWLATGRRVKIFTARVDGGQIALADGNEAGRQFVDVEAVKRPIEAWCLKHLGQVLEITNRKDYGMIQLWDDRCIQVEANTGIPVASCKDRKRKSYATTRDNPATENRAKIP